MAIQPLASFLASDFFAVALLILVAIISMRLLAGERERGTIELLYSMPIKDSEIVLGKFLGAWAFFCLVILVTLVHMGLYGAFGELDPRQILSSYVGLGLIGMAFVAVGLFCSCLVRNQIVAALLVFLLLGVTIFLGDIVSFVGVGKTAGGWSEYTSLMPHLDWATRGTIDSRTLLAMGSTWALSLFLSFCVLRANRQGIFWNVFESYSAKHWTNLLVALALAAATLVFLETHFAGSAAVKLVGLGLAAMLMALAWGPICRGRLAGTFSPWRFALVVASGPIVVGVGLLAWAYFEDVPRTILAVLIGVVIAAMLIPRYYKGQLGERLVAMGNIVVALVCVLMINVTGNYLAIKHHQALDISSGQAFSLSPAAKRVFEQQVKDGERVDVYCIISGSDYAGQHDAARRNLLERELRIFAESVNHPGNVKLAYRFLDPVEDSGEIGRLINLHDVNSNRQVLLVYRDQQYILDDRDLFELFPDRSRMGEFIANWRTYRERSGAQIPPAPKTEEEAYKLLTNIVENSPGLAEQAASFLALRAKSGFQQQMNEAILRLVRGKMQRICFMGGHGQAKVFSTESGASSAYRLRRVLRQHNYIPQQLEANEQIPQNCAALVILGPRERLAGEEIEQIDKYLAEGGRVLLAINPGCDGGLSKLLGKYGIIAPDNQAVIIGREGRVHTLVYLELPQINPWQPGHFIVEWATKWSQAKGRPVAFVIADGVRQVQKDPESELSDYLVSELLQVPPQYSASDDTSEAPRIVNGRRGPYPFMVIAEKLKAEPEGLDSARQRKKLSIDDVDPKGGKLLVVGDSDMFTDKAIQRGYGLMGQQVMTPLFDYPGSSNDALALMATAHLAGDLPTVEQITAKKHSVYVSEQMKAVYDDSRKLTGLVLWLGLPGA
ncbi:MAG: Gldg family protein, partial [Phycisphaerae bacterium]|nr:Gldg family protein [Phycisphaerae bacterium]